jgi:2-oxoglutarate ferredoxin oxidoreductase subunit beta
MGRTAGEMLRWMRDNSVRVSKAREMTEAQLKGKLVIGTFVDREAPEFNDACEAIIATAQNRKS